MLPARITGLARDSIANVSQIAALDRDVLTERVGILPRPALELILAGIEIVLRRS
jgi:mRNA interferase MazF